MSLELAAVFGAEGTLKIVGGQGADGEAVHGDLILLRHAAKLTRPLERIVADPNLRQMEREEERQVVEFASNCSSSISTWK